MRNRSVGEAAICTNHPTKSIHITHTNAVKLANLVAKEMNWPVYRIKYTHRDTKRIKARVWPHSQRMIVNKNGENVCTILHELAHHQSFHHDTIFKLTHVKLLNLWAKKWETKFTKEIPVETLIPKIISSYDVNKLLFQASTELIEDTDGICIPPKTVGKKLVELGINNLENLNKIKQMLREKGKLML